MNAEDFETKLTAFALNDPGLSEADRKVIESRIAVDPAARAQVEETRSLGQLLTKSLAAEPLPVGGSTTPKVLASTLEKRSPFKTLAISLASLAAGMMLAIFGQQMYQETRGSKEVASAPHIQLERKTVEPTDGSPNADSSASGSGIEAVGDVAERGKSEGAKKAIPDPAKYPGDATTASPTPAPTTTPPNEGFRGRNPATKSTAVASAGGNVPGPIPPAGPGGSRSGFGGGGGFPAGDAGLGGYPGTNTPTPGIGGPQAKQPGRGYPVAPTTSPIPGAKPADGKGDKWKVDSKIHDPSGEAKPDAYDRDLEKRAYDQRGGDQYRQLVENAFTRPEGINALSTFGVDVDTASYSIIRNMLNHNTLPHPDAVRLEEMVNYFPYRDAPPEGKEPFTVRVEMTECPWQPKHRLVRVALKAKPIDNAKRPPSNLVFLLDVSGSMDQPNKMPLVKASLKLLLDQLGENDRVAIVVYAGASGVVLDSTNATKKDEIAKALDNLTPGGSTNGGSGIHLAYEQAVKNFREGGTNRVILCTDGDFNVGTTTTNDLIKLIEENRKTGVFLSVFGFGMGNLRDEMMVQLAGKGNGNYGYIDSIMEAKKALVEQVSGTLVTVAKDVKVQIEFNPGKVAAYRLLGYEKRKLAAEDFHNDKKDAGEMGAGHVVTALYELIPVGTALGGEKPKVDGLRYQPVPEPMKPAVEDKTATEAFVVKLRHKLPDSDTSTLREIPVSDGAIAYNKASQDFQFASSVAAFAMLLKNSPYKGQATYALVEELAGASLTNDPGAYRAEFVQLVKKAKALTGQP